ncbi:E3 ubiquitin-protein ligase Fancl isoform X1 [Andrena cerasifolii]|uniref:E3 ubiquitin-protein ligase Fancl isoform X1 n=1 Tax=Andrena cerasifolii TaxID=2819439 RepID=UPI0040383A35
MVDNDYEAIVQGHPEMILVTETPVRTWQGFLTVSCQSNAGQNIRVKLKLAVPNYPSLYEAQIRFGKEIALIRNGSGFSQKVKDLMRTTTKVSLFFRQLQLLMSSFIDNACIEDHTYEAMDNSAMEILQELKDVLEIPSPVQLLSDSSLSTIKLSVRNVSLKLQRTNHRGYPWTVVYSDLPVMPAIGSFEKNVSTLTTARNKFNSQVMMLEKAWSNLEQIDEQCWVLDPPKPKPYHLYRRFYLTPSLSMFVKIDPLNPMDLPEIKFMGSEIEAELKRDLVSKNLHNWNPKCDFVDNLMMLLDMHRFPMKEEKICVDDKSAVVGDEECCICFSMESDTLAFPDKICSNEKCRRHFHTPCLLQWLQAGAGNHVMFDHIHGTCLHCQESISCCIK